MWWCLRFKLLSKSTVACDNFNVYVECFRCHTRTTTTTENATTNSSSKGAEIFAEIHMHCVHQKIWRESVAKTGNANGGSFAFATSEERAKRAVSDKFFHIFTSQMSQSMNPIGTLTSGPAQFNSNNTQFTQHITQRTTGILKVFSVMFSTLLRSGIVLLRQSIVLCSQEWFEH